MREPISVIQIVNSVYDSNTYLLTCQEATRIVAWIIDIGDVDKLIERLPMNATVKGVLFTHTHYDHIYGVNKLLSIFPNAVLVTNEFGKLALLSPKLNFSRYHQEAEDIVCNNPENIATVGSGVLRLCDEQFAEVYATPGHDESCLTYVINNYVFSGDSYIPGIRTRSTFPHSNKCLVAESERRIISLSNGKTLCPGHGPIFTDYRINSI